MSSTAAVVLAGGLGARMKSRLPKPLHRVCGIEMARHVIRAARGARIDLVTLVAPQDRYWLIRDTVGAFASVVRQPEPLGSGDALLQARVAVSGTATVLVLNSDVPLVRTETVGRLLEAHAEREADVTLLTCVVDRPDGLGRVIRSGDGSVRAVVEEHDAGESELSVREINCGVYCFRASWLWENLPSVEPSSSGETYLTDLVAIARRQGRTVETVATLDQTEALGVNDRVQLAAAEAAMRARIRERLMLDGVTMPDPSSVYVDAGVRVGTDTIILPNTHVLGHTRVGPDCVIGPNTVIEDSEVGAGCRVTASHVDGAILARGVEVGPFSRLRRGAYLETGVHLGNFVEVKNSRLGPGAKSGHFSYIGDADVGAEVNVGAGTVTCNYDGEQKHPTTIGDRAFIGSGTMLVAPVNVGEDAATGAGSVVTRDVPPGSMAVGMPARARRRGGSGGSQSP